MAVEERVQSLANRELKEFPALFVHPADERPENIKAIEGVEVPLISLSQPHEQLVQEVTKAAKDWGFFAITDHGVPPSLIKRLKEVGQDFFGLPQGEKEAYANDPFSGKIEGYGTKLPDLKFGWADYLYYFLAPPSLVNYDFWPKIPSYREVNEEYKKEMLRLYSELLGLLSEGLGLNEKVLKTCLGSDETEVEVKLKINFYPPCPQPQLSLGIQSHTDVTSISILVQNEVPGLQVLKDANWVAVDHHPDALFVVIGDQLEIISNGKYKSVSHRSMVNMERTRMSWALFINPLQQTVVGPLPELVDDEDPPKFPTRTFGEIRNCKYKISSH